MLAVAVGTPERPTVMPPFLADSCRLSGAGHCWQHPGQLRIIAAILKQPVEGDRFAWINLQADPLLGVCGRIHWRSATTVDGRCCIRNLD